MNEATNERVIEALIKVEAMSQDVAEIKKATTKLADAVAKLAVIEERQQRDRDDIQRAHRRLDVHDTRLGTLEAAQPLQKKTTEWVERAAWLIVGAVLAALLSLVVVDREAGVQRIPSMSVGR